MSLDNALVPFIFSDYYGGLNALLLSLGYSFCRCFVVVGIHLSISWVQVICD